VYVLAEKQLTVKSDWWCVSPRQPTFCVLCSLLVNASYSNTVATMCLHRIERVLCFDASGSITRTLHMTSSVSRSDMEHKGKLGQGTDRRHAVEPHCGLVEDLGLICQILIDDMQSKVLKTCKQDCSHVDRPINMEYAKVQS